MSAPTQGETAIEPLEQPYLLLVPIPFHRDADGEIWLEQLWHRDLVQHLEYLHRLTLAAPRYPEPPPDLVRVQVPPGSSLRCLELPRLDSMRDAVRTLPRMARLLWRAIGEARIVHSGVAGWPYPIGWLANPIAKLRGRKLVIVVESAPWRLTGSSDDNWARRVRNRAYEWVARWSVAHADLSIFTHESYRSALVRGPSNATAVLPASWINHEDIISEDGARRAWEAKLLQPPRFLFAGRLLPDKGVEVLLDALQMLDADGCRIEVDLIGAGRLEQRCAETIGRLRAVRARKLAPVPYGPPFFELLREHHALVVPTLSDEQPRVVFDAYAQAVPVIASDTDGHRAHVVDGETGWLGPRGDAAALAAALRRFASQGELLHRAGLAALRRAPQYTHHALHARRASILSEALGRR